MQSASVNCPNCQKPIKGKGEDKTKAEVDAAAALTYHLRHECKSTVKQA